MPIRRRRDPMFWRVQLNGTRYMISEENWRTFLKKIKNNPGSLQSIEELLKQYSEDPRLEERGH